MVFVYISVATPDQWELIREVRLRGLSEAPEAFCSTTQREVALGEEDWRARAGRSHLVLAFPGTDDVPGENDDFAAIGTASGVPDPHEAGGRELVGMWVDPSSRGVGVADALIDEIARWASAEGATSLALWVAEDNARARHRYEKCGFTVTGEREPMRPGTDQIRMRRVLS